MGGMSDDTMENAGLHCRPKVELERGKIPRRRASGGYPGPPPPSGQPRPPEAPTPSPPPSPANTVVISDGRGPTGGVPRLQWPGRSPIVCLVLVIVRVSLCVTVRPLCLFECLLVPRACSPSCVPRCTVPARLCLARSLHRVPQQQPPGPCRHYGDPRLNTHATAKCHPAASQLCCL